MLALERLNFLRAGLADCDDLLAEGDYVSCAELSASVADSAECAVARFNELAECLKSADNAEFGVYERWLGYAELAVEIGNAAIAVHNDCLDFIG